MKNILLVVLISYFLSPSKCSQIQVLISFVLFLWSLSL